ncbi:MAG: PSD1 and planctomycete cytochrome C domain-containing protein, partial [Bacteroidota bacterium]|nr:PSD1 and planctomycete cytochrome C domain-containing protein [Bacteroidota bacterium]
MKKIISIFLAFIFFFLFVLFFNVRSDKQVDFSAQVKPILNKHCISCHGGVKKTAGFSVLFESEAKGITHSGKPSIIPGNAKESEFIKRLHYTDPERRMPYHKSSLTKNEISILTDWVNQGANWGTHWAYLPVIKPKLPKISSVFEEKNFESNPIDYFVAARMEEVNLLPNFSAPKNIIARRLAFDITGLPPDSNLFKSFIEGEINYENYLDQLFLDSAFGEKWASWWLDLARYADTMGFEKDPGRTIWKYRDWVIKSLNRDLPFDQFTIEQLAGDLLNEPTTDQLIATAFHRNTMNNDEGGTDDEEFRVAAVIDRVNTTFDVWQSTTMSCVQCHSHPYDPFTHKEYYNVMAFFNNTSDEDLPDESPNLIDYNSNDLQKIKSVLDWIADNSDSKKVKLFKDFIMFKEPNYDAHHFNIIDNGFVSGPTLGLRKAGSAFIKNINSMGYQKLYLKFVGNTNHSKLIFRKNGINGEIIGRFKISKKGKNFYENPQGQIITSIDVRKETEKFDLYIELQTSDHSLSKEHIQINWIAFLPELPGKGKPDYDKVTKKLNEVLNIKGDMTPVIVENPNHMKRKTHVFDRGNWMVKMDEVHTGVPQILNAWQNHWTNNRLGFAKWLVDKKNPLTARTLVNRVWYQIFGRGLVSSLEDMGTMSDPPSHPALLDWLSYEFMHSMKWSVKKLIKTLVMSATYRQSSHISDEKLKIDANNIFYSRGPHIRLTAEEIRDQALHVSGLLSDKMYGPGVMPPQPNGIWEHAYLGNLWKTSEGEDRYRRGIYTYLKRTSPYPSMITFDAGSREVCLVRRSPTNTPMQALVTMNDPVFLEAALQLAKQFKDKDSKIAILEMYQKATFRMAE